MSLNLGPIHTWLWEKVLFTNSYTEFILDNLNNDELKNSINLKFEEISQRPLDQQIDFSNIHGWLQNQINLVENRFAYLIYLLKNNFWFDIKELETISFNFGLSYMISDINNLEDFYNYLNTLFLDGMPCDHVNIIIENESNSLIYKQTADIHSQYFETFNLDIRIYYLMKNKVISGIISQSNIEYYQIDDRTYKIIKR